MKYQNMHTQEIKTYRQVKALSLNISYPKDGTEMLGEDWKLIVTTPQPTYDVYTEGVIEIAPVNYLQTWEIYTLTQQELDANLVNAKQTKLLQLSRAVEANERPVVTVPLEDTSTIDIYAGRNDQFDIGDRYELMKEDSIPNLYVQEVDGTMQYLGHLDVKRCYKAITIHRNNGIEYQWAKETEINACMTVECVTAVTWNIV